MSEVLLVFAAAVIAVVLDTFVRGWRYREDEPAFSPAEIEWLREEAEGRISALAPRVMVLAEKERSVIRSLGRGELDGGWRAGGEELLVEAAADDFWRRFVVASALVEEKPVEALGELDRLPGLLEATISKLDKAEGICGGRRAV